MSSKPLEGKRILITRTKSQAKRFAENIRDLGGEPVVIPLISIVPPENQQPMLDAVRRIEQFDWLVLTSQNGVKAFFSVLEKEKIAKDQLTHIKIAVVGTKTKQAVENFGFQAYLIPEQHFTAEALIDALLGKIKKGEHVLMARGNLARDLLPEKLNEHGLHVVDVVAYETKLNQEGQKELIEEINNESLDVITFTSSSTVNHFVELLNKIDWKNKLKSTCLAAIGPITANTMNKYEIPPDVVAKVNTTEGLLEEIIHYFRRKKE